MGRSGRSQCCFGCGSRLKECLISMRKTNERIKERTHTYGIRLVQHRQPGIGLTRTRMVRGSFFKYGKPGIPITADRPNREVWRRELREKAPHQPVT